MRYTAFSTVTHGRNYCSEWLPLPSVGVSEALISGVCLERVMSNKAMWSDEVFGSGCVGDCCDKLKIYALLIATVLP